MIIEKIAGKIKKNLDGFDQNKMYNQMLRHYRLFNLIDKNGKWAIPELEKLSKDLLPKNMTEEKTKSFVDEMAGLAKKNPYLMNFLQNAEGHNFDKLNEKIKTEGHKVFPDVIALSSVLYRLTKVFYDHPEILEKCTKIFDAERKKSDVLKKMGLFHQVKFLSVDGPIKNIFLKAHKTGKVPPDALSFMVPLNILEATLGDYIMKNSDNGKTGLTLAWNRPGTSKYDPRTEAGPAKWSDDKKGISLSMPLPKKWADLYQTWNMAFVSQIQNFPYILPKLFIPQVAQYQEKPKDYIHKRALALYLYLNHFELDYLDRAKNNIPEINWKDEKLTKLWGKSNLESTLDYEKELAMRKATHILENSGDRSTTRVFNMSYSKSNIKKEAENAKYKMLDNLKQASLRKNTLLNIG